MSLFSAAFIKLNLGWKGTIGTFVSVSYAAESMYSFNEKNCNVSVNVMLDELSDNEDNDIKSEMILNSLNPIIQLSFLCNWLSTKSEFLNSGRSVSAPYIRCKMV